MSKIVDTAKGLAAMNKLHYLQTWYALGYQDAVANRMRSATTDSNEAVAYRAGVAAWRAGRPMTGMLD